MAQLCRYMKAEDGAGVQRKTLLAFSHIVEYYCAVKKNEIPTRASAWINLGNSEGNQVTY